jgi:type IV secretion system protein VirD4
MFTLIIQLFEGIFKLIFELLSLVFVSFSKKKGYHSDFATEGILLSRRYTGFCLTGRKNISVKDSYTNCLAIGGTGSGKTSVVLLPSLYSMQSSFVVHDPSGELFSKSVGYLASQGYKVKVLNFSKPEMSAGYNPLARAQSSSEIQKVASMLVANALGNNSKDPFWNTQATSLLSMLIMVLKKQSPEYYNLYNVRQLLNSLGGGNTHGIDALFRDYADDVLFAEYKSFIGMDEKMMSSVIATCKAALQIFSDDVVAKVTSSDTLDMKTFRERKVALFIQNSIADQKYYSVLTSIFFEQFFSNILSRFPENNEQDIFFLIDEASSLKLPTLPLAVANVRKHRAGILLIVQDFNQLVHSYGKQEADAIRANCFSKLFFTGASLETAKELEQTLGKFEYRDDEGKKAIRPLMTNDEIRTMPTNRALPICGHHAPIRVRLRPCYENRRYSQFCAIKPPIQKGESAEFLPILPLEKPDPTDA